MRVRLAAFLGLVFLIGGCAGDRVIVGAGTTTVDSGLMTALETEFGKPISVVGGSTAELLELAGQGAVDVVVVHDEAREAAFMAATPSAERRPAFVSSFLIVGPAADVAQLDATDAAAVFAQITNSQMTFVTRDDGSGTHSRELAIWEAAAATPPSNYIRTGQGMGLTLQVADQMDGFTLVEAGVYAAAADTIDLVPVPVADTALLGNPYSAILVGERGRDFFVWLTGPAGAAAIVTADAALFVNPVYAPAR